MVLMRTAFWELVTDEEEMVAPLTMLSLRPPTEPMERPWPPVQVPPEKLMSWSELVSKPDCHNTSYRVFHLQFLS
jgi:hypothetical protein